MKLLSWNVNGIRAVSKKNFFPWFEGQGADVICLQETKARPDQLDERQLHPQNYHSYFSSAKKPGYSGVAIYAKKEPLDVRYGIDIPQFDDEGRIIQATFKDFTLINAYFPNSQPEGVRLGFKLEFCQAILQHCESLRAAGKHVLLCGDYNIAHKEIDLKNPKTNEKNPGYFPEERAWMDTFTNHGYVDAFRKFEPGPNHYTWWSYRPGVRERNVGWRIDYFTSNPEFADKLKNCSHQTQTMGSDHCPVELVLK